EGRGEGEAAGQRHPLLLATGQLARMPFGVLAQADEREDVPHARGLVGAGKPAHAERERHVARDRHVREQRVVLEDHADVALVGLAARQLLAGELDDAAGRLLEAGDHHERRRLAGAARSEKRDELASRDVDADVVDGVDAPVVRLQEPVQSQVRHRRYPVTTPARGTMRASTITQPAPAALTTMGLRSSSSRLSRSAQANSARDSRQRASAATSPGGRPRNPTSNVAARVSAIIADASPSRSGKERRATSSNASIRTPPAPNASTSPNSRS